MATTTTENYLIAIRTLANEGEQPTLTRVAAHCGVPAPPMGEAGRRLERDGLLRIQPRKCVELTQAGRDLADRLLHRHRLLERWLTDGLGLDWATAHEEAHRLEHAVSPLVEDRIAASMNYPDTCPHGNPIMSAPDERSVDSRALSEVEAGIEVRLARISEIAEDNHELMAFYEGQGIVPGARLCVRDRGPLHGPFTVDVDGHNVAMSPEAAAYLRIEPPQLATA